jgi:hypothetical protein
MELEQEEINEQQKEEQQHRKEKLWKTIGVIFLIFGIIILVVWGSSSKNFKLFPFLGVAGGIVIIFVGMFWGIGIYRRMQELQEKVEGFGKLPSAITIEQARELIKEQLQDPTYADYCVGWKDHRIFNIGKGIKNRILWVHLDLVYSDKPYTFYLMNMHFPRELWAIITQDKYNPSELMRNINALSVSPEDEPNERVIEEENPMTGVKRKVTETHRQEEKEKEEKKKEDFT